MNEKDIRQVHVAAADLESIEFERDHAAMDLEEAVSTAVEHGEPVDDVAKAANLPPEDVIQSPLADDQGEELTDDSRPG